MTPPISPWKNRFMGSPAMTTANQSSWPTVKQRPALRWLPVVASCGGSLRPWSPLRAILSAVFFLMVAAFTNAAAPNIILMMGDDHGWEETGYNGHPHVKTPVLDAWAASGLTLTRFYAAHPNCSPTRVSFLTGRHPNRAGTFAPGWSLRPEEITIAHILAERGYRCGHFGKWHVGTVKAGSPTNPGAMGFHEWLSHDNFFEMDPPLSRNGGPPTVIPGESSAVLIDEAIRFLDRAHDADAAFLAVIWFGSPHEPYSGLPDDLRLYDDLPARYAKPVTVTSHETGLQVQRPQGEVLRERYAEITAMDRAIGRLSEHLARTGLRENTLLFYCGDNGTSPDAALGQPHRGAKSSLYEGGLLVPGLVHWPARIPRPRQVTTRLNTSDLLPTICRIVDAPLPGRPLDGIDMSPALFDAMHRREEPLCFWMLDHRPLAAAGSSPWMDPAAQQGTTPLVKLMHGRPTRQFLNLRFIDVPEDYQAGDRAIIDGDSKLIIQDRKGAPTHRLLFDLAADPAEARNLADREPDRVARLESLLEAWQLDVMRSLSGSDYTP
jgi:arylsulfatase A-like enzyme